MTLICDLEFDLQSPVRLIKFLLSQYAEVGVVGRPVLNHSETIKVYYGLSLYFNVTHTGAARVPEVYYGLSLNTFQRDSRGASRVPEVYYGLSLYFNVTHTAAARVPEVHYGLSLVQILDLDEKNQVLQTNVWSRYVSTDQYCRDFCLRTQNVPLLYQNIRTIGVGPT